MNVYFVQKFQIFCKILQKQQIFRKLKNFLREADLKNIKLRNAKFLDIRVYKKAI